MIDLIGKKVTATIIISVLVLLGAGGATYYYLYPMEQKYKNETSTLRSKTSELQAQITRITFEFKEIQKEINRYQELKARKFFNAQDRITAREAAMTVLRRSGLMDESTLAFEAAIEVPNPLAEKAGHKLISGPIKVEAKAMTDVDIYKFLLALQKSFPGYLQLVNFTVERETATPLKEAIKGLQEGKPKSMARAEINLIWWSMASQSQLEANPQLNPGLVPAQPVEGTP
jgi:hypothetical protein